jgi:4-hydroxy-tetrahydrodipicolinate reductase
MRIAIAGASGRMGRMLIQAVLESQDLTLAVALDRPGNDAIGQDAGAPLGIVTGTPITDDLGALAGADCLIDFTRPEGTLAHLRPASRMASNASSAPPVSTPRASRPSGPPPRKPPSSSPPT